MKKIIANLNYIAIILLISGFAILQSFGRSNIPGLVTLFLGVAAFGLYFFMNRKRLKNKNSRFNFIFASNLVLIILLSFGIIGAINYLGTKIHKRFDYTEGRIYSISDQSIQVVKNLQKDLMIRAFFPSNNSSAYRFSQIMDIYRYYSKHIKTEVIDPYKNPALVEKYDVKVINTMILEFGDKDTRIEDVSEEAITNAIIKVTRQQEKTVYFTQGHGEADIEKTDDFGFSEVKTNLEKMSYKVKSILLFQEPTVPSDASVLVVAGPTTPLSEKEQSLIEEYIFKRQGSVFFLLDPDQGKEFDSLLARLGVKLDETVIVEPKDQLTIALTGADHFTLYAIPSHMINKGMEHEIVKNFKLAVIYPKARSLTKLTPVPKETDISSVLSTGTNTWAATNFQEMLSKQEIIRNPADKNGPLDVMDAIQVTSEGKKSRVVVSGNSRFANNAYYYAQRKANGNLFNNVISWLGGEGDLIAIPPKNPGMHTIALTPGAVKFIFYYSLIILPLLVFIIGIGIWLYRRKL